MPGFLLKISQNFYKNELLRRISHTGIINVLLIDSPVTMLNSVPLQVVKPSKVLAAEVATDLLITMASNVSRPALSVDVQVAFLASLHLGGNLGRGWCLGGN